MKRTKVLLGLLIGSYTRLISRRRDMRKISLNLVFWTSLAASSSFGANLVSNPDFATGQLNPWVNNAQVDFGWVATADHTASNGCVGTDCVDQTHLATASYLYQNLATTPGET